MKRQYNTFLMWADLAVNKLNFDMIMSLKIIFYIEKGI